MARLQAAIASSPDALAQVSQSSASAGTAVAAASSAAAIGTRRQVRFGIRPPWPPRINVYRARRGSQLVSANKVKIEKLRPPMWAAGAMQFEPVWPVLGRDR